MDCSKQGLPVLQQLLGLLKLICIESVMPSSIHLTLFVPFSSCPQSFPASGSFQMSQLFKSGGQIIGVSASTSVLPMNTQDWSVLGWIGWISLQFKGLSRDFSNTKASILQCSAFFIVQLSHPYMTTGKTTALTRWTFYYYSVIKRKELLSYEDRGES